MRGHGGIAVEIPARGQRGAKLPQLPTWLKPAALWLFERQMKLARRGEPGRLGGNPARLHNLRAHPDEVTFEVDGATHHVTARTLDPDERNIAWRRIVSEAPGFGDYEKSTARVIPVVELTRTAP